MINNLDNRIKKLEQKHLPINRYPICFVNPGEDEDEVIAKHMEKYPRPPGSRLHIVHFVTPKTVRRNSLTQTVNED